MRNPSYLLLFIFLVVFGSCNHTGEKTKQPTTPSVPAKKVSIQEIEEGIKTFIQKKTTENDGYFHVTDRGKEFRMKLVRVHTEYLSNLGPESYFACVDLVDVSGDVYDVDFFMSGKPGEMTVTETSVHKLNGKPYYAWKQREDKTWYRMDVKEASTRLLGVIEGSDEFEFYYRVQLPEITSEAKLWLPIATTDTYQSVEITSIKAPAKHRMLTDEAFHNTIMYMELGPAQSGETVEVNYKVKRLEKSPYSEAGPVDAMYLKENIMMPVGGRFEQIAREATFGRDVNDMMKARALYDYIIDNMRYMKYGNYGRGDSNYACDVRTGNCTEFHSFFISLARSLGVPARFAVGASIPSDRNEGGIDGYHCWAEFYADGKWWPIDISEANKYTALATYYFGHHPANRIELSRGRDIRVQPGPASGPINFMAFPVFEISGKATQVKTTFSFLRQGNSAAGAVQ